jgi:hypothetical protein
MPARKTTKKAAKKSTKKATRPESGPVPPYGEAIRKATARGDAREMKNAAASARKWLADVQAALAQLDSALKNK